MSVTFLLPTPPPVRPEAEAFAQEIGALQGRFGGETVYINPNRWLPRHFPFQIPRPFFGFHQLAGLRRRAARCRLFQIYSPHLYPYPVLRRLGRPVVYTLTGGADTGVENPDFFAGLAAVTVQDPGSVALLEAAGIRNVRLVRAGVDTERFEVSRLELGTELRLLMASAPWTRAQFAEKGVDALLEAARRAPWLRLTFLWRGVLTAEMRRRVERAGLAGRVEVIDRQVDVNDALAGAHACVNLASRSDIVKVYPHSLLDSLAAGKPVLVSRTIPMAAYVEENGVGRVVEEVTPGAILEAADALRSGYDAARRAAEERGKADFGLEAMLDTYAEVYAAVDGW